MMTSWFSFFRRRRIQPTLTAIYVATGAGEPMQALTCVEAVSGRGVQGDRYCTGTGHWLSIEACQVTLITAHDLQQAVKNTSILIQKELNTGGHGCNLVIDGLKTRQLEGRSFGIGSAVFRYDKPRPPCGYIDPEGYQDTNTAALAPAPLQVREYLFDHHRAFSMQATTLTAPLHSWLAAVK